MAKSMPKCALPPNHPKHPTRPIYAARKIIHEQLATTQAHLQKLFIDREYLNDALAVQLYWRDGWPTKDPQHFRSCTIQAYEAVIQTPIWNYLAMRFLQKEVNSIRKTVQQDGIENVNDSVVYTLGQDLWQFGKLITLNLWISYKTESAGQMRQMIKYATETITHHGLPATPPTFLDRDRTQTLLWRLQCCQCFHQQERAFWEFFAYVLRDPSLKLSFNPEHLSMCLDLLRVFCHVIEALDVLPQGTRCNHKLGAGDLKHFAADCLQKGASIFEIAALTDHAMSVMENSWGRSKASLKLMNPRAYWTVILYHIRDDKSRLSVGASELGELLDIFQTAKPPQPSTLPARRVQNRVKNAAPIVIQHQQVPSAKFSQPKVSEQMTIYTIGIIQEEAEISKIGEEDQPSSILTIDQIHDEDQPTEQLKTIAKYEGRGYGKCNEVERARDTSKAADVHERVWRITSPEQYASVWRAIFPKTRQDRHISRVSWQLFVDAMTSDPVSCRIKKSDGVLFVFERKGENGGREVFQCHAPHNLAWIPITDLYRYRKDLRDTFGMDTHKIVLAE